MVNGHNEQLKRRTALVLEILRGDTSVVEARESMP
jgi:hypothetical protein